jgi:hypothetical protein
MIKQRAKSKPTWADVKSELTSFDRAGLMSVLQSLYTAAEGNRAFLHARFGLAEDPLQPYKKRIHRWLRPNVFHGQAPSASNAKKAIAEYKQALGDPEGLAELMVFYCEQAAEFCRDVDYHDTAYLDALVRMFEQALKTTSDLNRKAQKNFLTRLDRVRTIARQLGYGVGDDMDVLLSEFASSFQSDGGLWK